MLSPNFNERPEAVPLELIVIHNISLPPNKFGGGWVQRLFTNTLPANEHPYFAEIHELTVSSHFFIERTGVITQFVGCDKRAWHAGQSKWRGRDNCNDFSIGIELEGTDFSPFEAPQYDSLAKLVSALICEYPTLNADNIIGHEHIAPGRKTDPGPFFDWQRLQHDLKQQLRLGEEQ